MDHETIKVLLTLNREFYQRFASPFSATRRQVQPGVRKVLEWISRNLPESRRFLDLGCGNGTLAYELNNAGFKGEYIGLDASQDLLETARTVIPKLEGSNMHLSFIQSNLAEAGWELKLPDHHPFDVVFAFAVIHHLPGNTLRLQLLNQVNALLKSQGCFFLSVWQFMNSPRLRNRIQPWNTIGLEQNQLELGDTLLDWRHGGKGLRYVHHFTEAELNFLAEQSGFKVMETFLSDGKGGNLGLYQVWENSIIH